MHEGGRLTISGPARVPASRTAGAHPKVGQGRALPVSVGSRGSDARARLCLANLLQVTRAAGAGWAEAQGPGSLTLALRSSSCEVLCRGLGGVNRR